MPGIYSQSSINCGGGSTSHSSRRTRRRERKRGRGGVIAVASSSSTSSSNFGHYTFCQRFLALTSGLPKLFITISESGKNNHSQILITNFKFYIYQPELSLGRGTGNEIAAAKILGISAM